MSKKYPATFDHYINGFEKARKKAVGFVTPLNDELFITKPNLNSWCIAECYGHLIQTGKMYLAKVDEGMSKAASGNIHPKTPMRLRLHMKWFVQYLEPPVSMKATAPAAFQPTSDHSLNKDTILQDFLNQVDSFLKHLNRASQEHINLSSIKVSNPLISFVGMTLAECIAVTEAHTRRHMEQAEKVLEQVSQTP